MSEPIAQQASPLGPSPSQARPSQGRQRAMSLHGSVAPVMSKANKKSKMDQAVAVCILDVNCIVWKSSAM